MPAFGPSATSAIGGQADLELARRFMSNGLAKKSQRQKSNFASGLNPICPVQPCREKYSASVVGQISGLNPRVSPE
jgi:hypothetical protein